MYYNYREEITNKLSQRIMACKLPNQKLNTKRKKISFQYFMKERVSLFHPINQKYFKQKHYSSQIPLRKPLFATKLRYNQF